MRKKTFTTIAAAVTLVAGLAACSSDDNDVDISIPDDDVDCCSLEEEELTIRYLQDYEQIGSVGELQTDIYTIRLYSAGGKLLVGYNELFFTVIKTATGRHVKDVEFDSIAPLMTMQMAMGTHSHSTPTGSARRVASWIPVFRSHVAFLMPSNASAGNTWQLAFDYRIRETSGRFESLLVEVAAAPEGSAWILSFVWNEDTYYLTIAEPQKLVVGINEVRAVVSKKAAGQSATEPYADAAETFSIEVVPTMPDMGNHTSPGNEPLLFDSSAGLYKGRLNLTMTGRWDIHLVVRDAEGTAVAGDDTDGDGLSDIYWTIFI